MSKQQAWLLLKWLTVVLIVAMVGFAFVKALADLERHELHWEPAWLAAAGGLYLVGIGFSAIYWWWLLRSLEQPIGLWAAVRAYYLGHLGKYVPGKALVIIMRTALVRGPGVRSGVAALSVAYEGMTMMASGALVAIALIGFTVADPWQSALEVAVMLPAILLTVPAIFNPLVRKVANRFRGADAEPLPRFRTTTLLVGLGLNAAGWVVLGVSLWMAVAAVTEHDFGWRALAECTAFVSMATVVGFYTPAPGGLGAREGVLLLLLTPVIGDGPAGLAALLLRLAWIAAEVGISMVLYPAPSLALRFTRSQNTNS